MVMIALCSSLIGARLARFCRGAWIALVPPQRLAQVSATKVAMLPVFTWHMKTICAALLLVALSLGGCCLSGSGCNAPQPTALTNWDDGLDQPPEEAAAPAARKQHVDKRAKAQKAKPASDSANSANSWQDEENQRAADDARLKRKLMICQNCAVTEQGTGSATR